MTNELIPYQKPNDLLAEMTNLSDEALYGELREGLVLMAGRVMRMACAVRVLEGRGKDLSGLRVGMMDNLRRIAWGQMEADVVVQFHDLPSLRDLIGKLALPDQRRLIAGEPLPMMVYAPTGELTRLLRDVRGMTPAEIAQVFDARRHVIRDEAEQTAYLSRKLTAARNRAAGPDKIGALRLDRELGGAYCGRRFIPLVDLVAAVNVLRKQGGE